MAGSPTTDLSGSTPNSGQFNRREVHVEAAWCAVSQRLFCNQLAQSGTPAVTVQEKAEAFMEDLLGAVKTELSEKPWRRRALEWNMPAEACAAPADALDKRLAARCAFKANPNPATWRMLKAKYKT